MRLERPMNYHIFTLSFGLPSLFSEPVPCNCASSCPTPSRLLIAEHCFLCMAMKEAQLCQSSPTPPPTLQPPPSSSTVPQYSVDGNVIGLPTPQVASEGWNASNYLRLAPSRPSKDHPSAPQVSQAPSNNVCMPLSLIDVHRIVCVAAMGRAQLTRSKLACPWMMSTPGSRPRRLPLR